jgi:3-dehydroquinate synthetase
MWLEEISDQSPLNWARTLNPDDLWVAILRDKKNQKGVVLDVALERIGRAIWDQPLSFNEFTSTWKQVFE